MATGDAQDVLSRLQRQVVSWFGSAPSLLNSLLQAPAWALSWVYSLYAYARLQTRVATTTDGFLDLVALDYFGASLQRLPNETDDVFRSRVQPQLLHPGVTRAGMTTVLTAMTGRAPRIFEPARPMDTGAWGGCPYGGYGVAGGYTNPALIPYQALIIVYRGNNVPDVQLFAAVDAAKPAATTMWTALSN